MLGQSPLSFSNRRGYCCRIRPWGQIGVGIIGVADVRILELIGEGGEGDGGLLRYMRDTWFFS